MSGKINIYKSIICVWIAVLGVAFTTISVYDFNPKFMVIEIAEELEEDGCEKTEKNENKTLELAQFCAANRLELVLHDNALNSIRTNEAYSTCKGYILDMIKPPLH